MVRVLPLLAVTAVLGCAPASKKEDPTPPVTDAEVETTAECDATAAAVQFPVSPGGTPEAPPELVRDQACRLRIVDVREREELGGELGAMAGAEHLPQRRVAAEALSWDRDQPLVLVCRSGRRSGAAVRQLQLMGFTNVASMTGGMISWNEHGYPTVDGGVLPSAATTHPGPVHKHAISKEDVAAHIADRDHVRWTKAASLMLDGTQACVDGRDAHAIVGTPGGDVGELVLALATAERISGQAFSPQRVGHIFDAYLDAFGYFYMHSDDHAVSAVMDTLGAAHGYAALPSGHDAAAAATVVQDPPAQLQDALLQLLVEPDHVGCGHLRLMLQHPDEYGVRRELVADVLRAFYRRLWDKNPAVDFVVLQGGHEESAVVTVELANEVHAYTRIPLVSPRLGDTEIFVAHPQVASFVRRENAAFILEQNSVSQPAGVDADTFFEGLETLAGQQLAATLDHLAPDLPRYRVRFDGESFDVIGPATESNDARVR